MSREGEVPTRVEEQDSSAAPLHDEGHAAGPDDLCHAVGKGSGEAQDRHNLSVAKLAGLSTKAMCV